MLPYKAIRCSSFAYDSRKSSQFKRPLWLFMVNVLVIDWKITEYS